MKFTLDQRTKHRIVGAFVMASIAAIFLPAMMKKSNYRLDRFTTVSVRLPPKPKTPQVAMMDKEAVFHRVKVAHVDVPAANDLDELTPNDRMKAEPISKEVLEVASAARPAALKAATTTKTLKKLPQKTSLKPHSVQPAQLAVKRGNIKKEVQRLISKSAQKEVYAVQLASFAQQNNAKSLVSLLRKKGYQANYAKLDSKNGAIYKVMVGSVPQRDAAYTLQKELANNLQLKGFVVKTGVS